jgi:thioredoxin-related protein
MVAAVFFGCNRNGLTVDMNKTDTDTNAPPVNLASEIARAKAENKLLLMEFGSSDSCPPCVAFQQYVVSTPQFAAYEKSNLVYVRLDFPLKHALRPDTRATNYFLAQQFNISPFPTFIALNPDGKEFWRQEGLTIHQLEPINFITLLDNVRKTEKK